MGNSKLRLLVCTDYRDMDISGYCYTQLTDVEQETNGLLTADRTPKVPVEKIAEIIN